LSRIIHDDLLIKLVDADLGIGTHNPLVATRAKLTAIRFGGKASPIEANAARKRSRDSATALSASPTIAMAGKPLAICI